MAECKYKKRLQFYLDGWTDGSSARDLEEHLKLCHQCQVELAELEELGSAALEIIDQAPDKAYWESFSTRVQNRIFSRNVNPAAVERKAPRIFFFRLASILTIVIALSASTFLLFRPEVRIPDGAQVAPSRVEQPVDGAAAVSGALPLDETVSPVVEPDASASNMTSPSLEPSQPEPNQDLVSVPRGLPPEPERSPADLRAKDISAQFRQAPLIGQAQLKLDTEAGILALAAEPSLIDPSYRLRSSFIGQRLLAGLGMNAQNGSPVTLSGRLSGFSSSSPAFAWEDFEEDIASSWGYLRIASDTSKSNEIKKYFIELELMQSR